MFFNAGQGAVLVVALRPSTLIGNREHVVAAPHHSLRHSGRTTGVNHEDIVATRQGQREVFGDIKLRTVVRPVRVRTEPIVDDVDIAEILVTLANARDDVDKCDVRNNGSRIGVLNQVGDLVDAVEIIHVDGHGACRQRATECREVFGAGVEIEGNGITRLHAIRHEALRPAIYLSHEVAP